MEKKVLMLSSNQGYLSKEKKNNGKLKNLKLKTNENIKKK